MEKQKETILEQATKVVSKIFGVLANDPQIAQEVVEKSLNMDTEQKTSQEEPKVAEPKETPSPVKEEKVEEVALKSLSEAQMADVDQIIEARMQDLGKEISDKLSDVVTQALKEKSIQEPAAKEEPKAETKEEEKYAAMQKRLEELEEQYMTRKSVMSASGINPQTVSRFPQDVGGMTKDGICDLISQGIKDKSLNESAMFHFEGTGNLTAEARKYCEAQAKK